MEKKKTYWGTGSWWKSMILASPMFLIMLVMMGSNVNDDITSLLSFGTTLLFFASMFYMIIYSGKTDKWRAILFVSAAVLFCISFIHNLIDIRGTMTYSDNEMLECKIPFCHIVTTMVIIPAALKQTIIFPGSLVNGFASISSMLIIVLGFSIALGRGFCSWGCFYGGWDDGFSRIKKEAFYKKVNTAWRWFAMAMLIIMALWSAETLMPSYCSWLCPFKLVTENEKIVDITTLMQNIVFTSLFLGLVVILPILTRKRIQCATFCPMGALLSLFNKINLFEVKNDEKKCIKCGKCEKACPMLAIEQLKTKMNCSKCGKCVDICPTGAMQYHIKGTNISHHETTARLLYLYPAFAFMVTMLGTSAMNAIHIIISFIF